MSEPLQIELDKKKKQRADYQSRASKLNKEITFLEKAVGVGVTVTEHAIVRYFERVEGRDIALIRAAILPDDLKKQISDAVNGEFPHEIDNVPVMLVVKNKAVITINPKTNDKDN
jgi:hypothetical protein